MNEILKGNRKTGVIRFRHFHTRAFTLVELLAVLAITVILVAILLPAISKVRSHAHTTQCASNLRQIGTAALSYTTDNGGRFPLAFVWDKEIAKYMSLPTDSNGVPTSPCDIFRCPEDPSTRGNIQRSYTASRMQVDPKDKRGVFGRGTIPNALGERVPQESRSLYDLEAPEYTIMIAELFNANNIQWKTGYVATDGWLNGIGPVFPDGTHYHADGANYVFCDAHVEFLTGKEVLKNNPSEKGWRNGHWAVSK